ncbi:hypothetical protein MKX08_009183 [Trichoderma sp. CBMAI-0020]|nr:hypothetical protein MKX08_009183 [Trichoderma sp. CBMAI-0020]
MSSPEEIKEANDKALVKNLTAAVVNAFPRDIGLRVAKSISVTPPNPRVGVSTLIQNENGQFLVGQRKGSHGAGTVQTPGGHIDYGEEELFKVAQREVEEETDLKVTGRKILTITNDVFEAESKHYITIWVICTMNEAGVKPKVKETDKCEWWKWMSATELAEMDKAAESRKKEKKAKGEELDPPAGDELFLPLANLLKQVGADGLDSYIASKEGLPNVK